MRILLIIFYGHFLLTATAQSNVLVYFKDKGPDSENKLQHPEKFLSEEAIERRIICNSAFDIPDLPVCREYTEVLKQNNCMIESESKWLNAAMVSTSTQNLHLLLQLPFVDKIEVWNTYHNHANNTTAAGSIFNYGSASLQINMINLDKLHDQGYTGNNVLICVCDDGFNSVNTLGAFQYLRSRNRIKATRDFVTNDGDVYLDDVHGTQVFSILAANLDGGVIGSGFDADFLLARTENALSETHSEEYNWVLASEWADSAGARIIQSSLGYSDFDSGVNYTPSDMDGRTAIITKAAVIATRKGIIIVNSAGNEGANSFRKITAPADADSILSVGSVDGAMARVHNSGQGPSADNRIKPDVMAMGGNTAYVNNSNTVSFGTGTSYASPLIAGLCACLLQKNNYVTNIELINAVKRSADRYSNPDTLYGYGIPNAYIADTILQNISRGRGIYSINNRNEPVIKNTLTSGPLELNIRFDKPVIVEIYNVSGSMISKSELARSSMDISNLAYGNYFLKVNGRFVGKFCKE